MKTWHWRAFAAVAAWGLLCGSTVLAQGRIPVATSYELQQVASRPQAASTMFTRGVFYAPVLNAMQGPDEGEPEKAPVPDEAYDSPSDALEAPATRQPLRPAPLSMPDVGTVELADDSIGCASCGDGVAMAWDGGGHGRCSPCSACRNKRRRHGISWGGWLDQGFTTNGRHTVGRFNGPVGFNDRDGEYQMNQFWLFAEKEVDTSGCGLDLGGRIDLLYGTDWRFTPANGLEDDWNHERFYGLAMPQMYMDVGYNNLLVRAGHFFTIVGYESVPAPDNFFYSHSYSMLYGEPFTHTGALASYALSDNLSVSGGFGRGWDNWADNNDRLEYLGGIAWTSCDDSTSLALAVTTGDYDDAGQHNRTMYSFVFARQFTRKLTYVLQYDWGYDDAGGVLNGANQREDAEWYGINQYWIYELNRCWSLGMRVEWFSDDDGTRVGGVGRPSQLGLEHGWAEGPAVDQNLIGWAGDFYQLTLGLNWKPHENITVRPECRWDWYSGPANGRGRFPFDSFANTRVNQFTFGTDLILTF